MFGRGRGRGRDDANPHFHPRPHPRLPHTLSPLPAPRSPCSLRVPFSILTLIIHASVLSLNPHAILLLWGAWRRWCIRIYCYRGRTGPVAIGGYGTDIYTDTLYHRTRSPSYILPQSYYIFFVLSYSAVECRSWASNLSIQCLSCVWGIGRNGVPSCQCMDMACRLRLRTLGLRPSQNPSHFQRLGAKSRNCHLLCPIVGAYSVYFRFDSIYIVVNSNDFHITICSICTTIPGA